MAPPRRQVSAQKGGFCKMVRLQHGQWQKFSQRERRFVYNEYCIFNRTTKGNSCMSWLDNLFAKPKPKSKSKRRADPTNSTSYHDLEEAPVPLAPTKVDIQNARDVVNQAALKTAQAHGIPAGWLSFEVLTIADEKNAYFQLQVVMNIWDEHLAIHNLAFQNAVIKRVRDESLDVGRALRAVLWRVSPDAGCPYDDMPPAQAWTADAVRKRSIVRERINRELYALSVPASGAAVPTNKAASATSAGGVAQPAGTGNASKHEGLLDDSAFGDTRPSTFNGFAATQPYSPLMSDVVEPPKK
jgi:hypothetical protein